MPKTKTALADPDRWKDGKIPAVWAGSGDCPNCDGRKRMDCVTRTVHDACQDDCPVCCDPSGQVRTFSTGATRDTEVGKLDFEAFLSPKVLVRYAEYMHEHRKRSDGTMRDGDDWQKGIPRDVYMKSLMRHVMDVWLMHRGQPGEATNDMDVALCAVIFNAMGYLFNWMEGIE